MALFPDWDSIPLTKVITEEDLYNAVYVDYKIKRRTNLTANSKRACVASKVFPYTFTSDPLDRTSSASNRLLTRYTSSNAPVIAITDITPSVTYKLSSGKILLANSTPFKPTTESANNTVGSLLRFNPNGTLDTTFKNNNVLMYSSFVSSAKVFDMVELPNGNIVIVGRFNSVQDVYITNTTIHAASNKPTPIGFALFDANGNYLDSSPLNLHTGINNDFLIPQTSPALSMRCILADSTNIYIGGRFKGISVFNGTSSTNYDVNCFVSFNISTGQLNTTLRNNFLGVTHDLWFYTNNNDDIPRINTMVFDGSGNILMGGVFDRINKGSNYGQAIEPCNAIIKISNTGIKVTSFAQPYLGDPPSWKNTEVYDMKKDDFGNIYFAGFFDRINTIVRSGIGFMDSNGGTNYLFNLTGQGFIDNETSDSFIWGVIYAIAVTSDGVICQGWMNKFNSSTQNCSGTTLITNSGNVASYWGYNGNGVNINHSSISISKTEIKNHILKYSNGEYYFSIELGLNVKTNGNIISSDTVNPRRWMYSVKTDAYGNIDKLW